MQAPPPANNAPEPEGGSTQVEEIVVTARKHEERLQNVPIAVTAITAAQLENRNISDIRDVERVAPNTTIAAGSGNSGAAFAPSIFIRGVGQTDYLLTVDPGVGIYLDGVYIARAVGSLLDAVDFERVEVLRGPQGTLFGKNTIGGAINITTGRPASTFQGYIDATGGERDRGDLRAMLEGPLGDAVSGRVTVASLNRDGYIDRPAVGDTLGGRHSRLVDAVLDWDVTDDFTVTLAADGTDYQGGSSADRVVAINPSAPILSLWNALVGARQGVQITPALLAETGKYQNLGTGPNQNLLHMAGASATEEWQTDYVKIRSITAYRGFDARYGDDADNTRAVYAETSQKDNQWQFSQELQLSGSVLDDRLSWTFGAYYFVEHATDYNSIRLASGLYEALNQLPFPLGSIGGKDNPANASLDLDWDIYDAQRTRSNAEFGELSYKILDNLTVTAGLRYSQDRKIFNYNQFSIGIGQTRPPVTVEDSWAAVTPHYQLAYQADDDLLYYVSASRGFKSGGFNGRATSSDSQLEPFGPEYVWSYEAGVKADWLDHRVRTNAAIFRTNYSQIQLTALNTDPRSGALVNVTRNAGNGQIDGAEVEMTGELTGGLEFNVNAGFLDAKYTKIDPDAAETVSLSSKFPKTPRFTTDIGLQYTYQPPSFGVFLARLDYAWRSSQYQDFENTPVLKQNAYGLLNMHFSYQFPDKSWKISIYANNLTDKYYYGNGTAALSSLGLASAVIGAPREVGGEVRWNF